MVRQQPCVLDGQFSALGQSFGCCIMQRLTTARNIGPKQAGSRRISLATSLKILRILDDVNGVPKFAGAVLLGGAKRPQQNPHSGSQRRVFGRAAPGTCSVSAARKDRATNSNVGQQVCPRIDPAPGVRVSHACAEGNVHYRNLSDVSKHKGEPGLVLQQTRAEFLSFCSEVVSAVLFEWSRL